MPDTAAVRETLPQSWDCSGCAGQFQTPRRRWSMPDPALALVNTRPRARVLPRLASQCQTQHRGTGLDYASQSRHSIVQACQLAGLVNTRHNPSGGTKQDRFLVCSSWLVKTQLRTARLSMLVNTRHSMKQADKLAGLVNPDTTQG